MIALVTEVDNIYYMKFVKTSKLAPYDPHEVTQFIAQFTGNHMIKQMIVSDEYQVYTWGDRVGQLRPSAERFNNVRQFNDFNDVWAYIDRNYPFVDGLLLKDGTWRHFYGEDVEPDGENFPRFVLSYTDVVEYLENIGYERMNQTQLRLRIDSRADATDIKLGDIIRVLENERMYDAFYRVTNTTPMTFDVTYIATKVLSASDSLTHEALYHFYAALPGEYDNRRVFCPFMVYDIYRKQ